MEMDRPSAKQEKQARKGMVFPFEPAPLWRCCKKKQCAQYFTDADAPIIVGARRPLLDPALGRDSLRATFLVNWGAYLRIPGSNEVCCKKDNVKDIQLLFLSYLW